MLLLACFYATHAPKISFEEPISVTILEPKDEVKEAKKDDEISKQMIVQRSEGDLADKAKKDAYLSDKTRTVREERSAKQSGEVGAAVPVPPMTAAKPNPKAKKGESKAKDVTLNDLGLKFVPKKETNFEKERNWANAQMGETLRGGQYIQGMKDGETSALNTKEFVFFSYFDRVRRQLDQAWQPILREQIQRIYKTGRHLASNADYTTKTLVTLTKKGEIERVQVLEESGTFDLDQAAIDALNHAGPYPNPPQGLVGGDGRVQIRWDFILKT
ncbi:MAG: TonB family protein [Bdellovibrionales bacterium]|nr:TonB family protein [Bdellovibrionales bacterium]